MAATHREDRVALQMPALRVGRRRREARRRRRLTEVDGFLDELRLSLGERQSTLVRALEGYRRTLRSR